jgi:hypothetical protein
MQHTTKHIQPGKLFNPFPVYLLLAVSGLSFCFFLGFPFNNHNESFLWVVALNKVSLWDTLTRQVISIESFRPLGMANAWLTYKLSGNIYLQQVLNWLFAISSFALLFAEVRNKIFFSLLSSLTAACFFSGYIYLFHLHGVFYGPFQLYVAALACIAFRKSHLGSGMLAITAGLTLIASLYHTFALLVYCAFLAGYAIQLYKNSKKIEYLRLLLLLAATVAFAKIILQHKEMHSLQYMVNGFITSYNLTEINTFFSCAATVLAMLAIFPVMNTKCSAIIMCSLVFIVSVLFIYLQLPVLILWVALSFVKMAVRRNWPMAGLIVATGILPVGSGSGSPTYVVFALMICVFVTAEDEKFYIKDSLLLRKFSLLAMLFLIVCLTTIKAGFVIPLVSLIAKPILSEKEKTYQLDDIICWKLKNDEFSSFRLLFYDTWALPVNSKNSVTRTNRPVTEQSYFNEYLDFFSNSKPNALKTSTLYITFGDKILKGRELVFFVNGKWNGRACVFR